jgi:hypothetical protein
MVYARFLGRDHRDCVARLDLATDEPAEYFDPVSGEWVVSDELGLRIKYKGAGYEISETEALAILEQQKRAVE